MENPVDVSLKKLPCFSVFSEHRYTSLLLQIAAYPLLLSFLFTMWPRAWINIAVWTSIILVVFSGNWIDVIKKILRNPVSLLALILGALFWVGIFYSIAPMASAIDIARKYSWLFYPVILLPVFQAYFSNQKWQHVAYFLFICGVLSIAIISIVDSWFGWNLQSFIINSGKFRFGPSLSFGAFLALQLFGTKGKSRYFKVFYLMAFIIVTYSIFFILTTRTGYICYYLLALTYVFQNFSYRSLVYAAVFLFGLSYFAYIFSLATPPSFKYEMNLLGEAAVEMVQGSLVSSPGDRVVMAVNGAEIFKSHPVWGYGTGSYGRAYLLMKKKNELQNKKEFSLGHEQIPFTDVTNPHNEYTMIAVQLGGVGLLVFLSWLAAMFLKSFQLLNLQRKLAQGLVLVFVGSCFGGALLYTDERFYFVMLSGLFFFSNLNKKGH